MENRRLHTAALLGLAACLLYFSACAPDGALHIDREAARKDSLQLVRQGDWALALDDVTTPTSAFVTCYTDPDLGEVFAFINKQKHRIYVYKIGETDARRRLEYKRKGENPLPYLNSFAVHKDSFYIVDDIESVLWRISALDSGKVGRVDCVFANQDMSLATMDTNNSAVSIRGGRLYALSYLAGCMGPDAATGVFSVVDLQSGRVSNLGSHPADAFGDDWWHCSSQFGKPYAAYNSHLGQMLVSFAGDDRVFAYDLGSGAETRVLAGSQHFSFEHESLWANMPKEDRDKRFAYFWRHPRYGSLLYDAARRLYYRFVINPGGIDFDDQTPMEEMPLNVLILDENLDILGEAELPRDGRFRFYNAFAFSGGLAIPYETDNEDEWRFAIFTPQAR